VSAHPSTWRSILILSFHLHLVLTSGLNYVHSPHVCNCWFTKSIAYVMCRLCVWTASFLNCTLPDSGFIVYYHQIRR
jgi:hypothetical protein